MPRAAAPPSTSSPRKGRAAASGASPPPPSGRLTTGALCDRAAVTRGMLRLYEREGLIEAPPRTGAGYRLYAADTPARLTAIRQLKEVGFSLREIALLLAEHDTEGLSPTRIRRLAREQVAQIDLRIARLQVVREYVAAVAAGDLAALDDPACSFLLRFLGATTPSQSRREPAPVTE